MMCEIDWGLVSNITVTGIAALVAYFNYSAFVKFSDITLDRDLQQMILNKSKDCNAIFEERKSSRFNIIPHIPIDTSYIDVITEIIISIQLLDNSLSQLEFKKRDIIRKRKYFLSQFWIQLNTDLRGYIKNKTTEDTSLDKNSISHKQLNDVITTFEFLFKKY